jgi:hypothetical protein
VPTGRRARVAGPGPAAPQAAARRSAHGRGGQTQASIDGATPGEVTVDTTTNTGCGQTNVQLIVRTFDSAGTAGDRAFQVQVTGTGG